MTAGVRHAFFPNGTQGQRQVPAHSSPPIGTRRRWNAAMHFSRDAPGRHEALPAWPSGVCPAGAAPSPPRQGRGQACPPAQGHGFATHEVPGNPRFQVPMDTMEWHRTGATEIWQSCPQEDPVSGLTVCHPAEPVSQLLSSCLTNKPQGPAGQLKGLSKPPADSRSWQRDWEGESRHPPCFSSPLWILRCHAINSLYKFSLIL